MRPAVSRRRRPTPFRLPLCRESRRRDWAPASARREGDAEVAMLVAGTSDKTWMSSVRRRALARGCGSSLRACRRWDHEEAVSVCRSVGASANRQTGGWRWTMRATGPSRRNSACWMTGGGMASTACSEVTNHTVAISGERRAHVGVVDVPCTATTRGPSVGGHVGPTAARDRRRGWSDRRSAGATPRPRAGRASPVAGGCRRGSRRCLQRVSVPALGRGSLAPFGPCAGHLRDLGKIERRTSLCSLRAGAQRVYDRNW